MAAPFNPIDAKSETEITANVALGLTHRGRLLINRTASSFTATLQTDATVNFPIGAEIALQENPGQLKLVISAGVTVRDIDDVILLGTRDVAGRTILRKTGLNTWRLEEVELVKQSPIVTFNAELNFDTLLKTYAEHTVVGPIAFTVGAQTKVPGARVLYRLIADGVNTPTFSIGMQVAGDYLNFAGAVNLIEFVHDGTSTWARITNANPFSGTPFQMGIKTDNPGSSASNQFTIPVNPDYFYDYYVAWGDGQFDRITSNASPTHTYPSDGNYTISIWGNFPTIQFGGTAEQLKILTVSQWGTSIDWLTMDSAFYGCSNLTVTATLNDSQQAKFQRCRSWVAAFLGCTSLTSYAPIDMSKAEILDNCWLNCTSITSFDGLSLPSAQSVSYVWAGCTALTTFTADMPSATYVGYAWAGCTALTTFTAYMPSAIYVGYAWTGCTALTTFTADMPSAQSVNYAWSNCTALTTFTADMPSAISANYAWAECTALTTFSLDIPRAMSVNYAWFGCTALTTFNSNIRSVATGRTEFAWKDCPAIATFVSPYLGATFSVENCNLSAAAINTMFENLAPLLVSGSATVTVTGNPGAATCTQSLATAKGWLVVV